MAGMRPFQIILLAGSVFVFFAAIAFLALYRPSDDTGPRFTQDIVVWGTLDQRVFVDQVRAIEKNDDRFTRVSYEQFDEEAFIPEFVNALAERRGPDLILIRHDQLVQLRSKLYVISYETFPERNFRDLYVEGAEIFARTDGIYALPFAVDPLVMYWNRDIFSSNNIALPPNTWEQLRNDTVPRLTRTGGAFDILQSAVAFGEYQNVRNAKEVLSMLMMQSGSVMVEEDNNGYEVAIQKQLGGTTLSNSPAATSLSFYTEFANPASSLYSWNRSLPEDRQRFLSGNLALYFGYGSELSELQAANPNLNFDMAEVPQGRGAQILRNYGTFYGFAIPAVATNPAASYQVGLAMAGSGNAKIIAEGIEMAPVHRQTIAAGTIDLYQAVRNKAALIAHGWLEPNPEATEAAFKSMVEDVTSGRQPVSGAASNAASRLRLAF